MDLLLSKRGVNDFFHFIFGHGKARPESLRWDVVLMAGDGGVALLVVLRVAIVPPRFGSVHRHQLNRKFVQATGC